MVFFHQPSTFRRMKQTTLRLSLLFSALFQPSLAYKWPNPQIDEVDHTLFDQSGYKENLLFSGVRGCVDTFRTGRTTAAEWLMTAFHDVATHDAAAGTGGLDASVSVEAFRAENAGPAINETISFFSAFISPRMPLADLIALGAVAAMDACGGPEIPFRAGRVDNFTPAPPGVPEPHQSIQSYIDAFSRMGFSQEEMIGLVACGHSIGGVHHEVHPEIVPPPVNPEESRTGRQSFDSTPGAFENKVATEFMSGTPNNPLAFGANETTNSDFRIFTSDGNSTISRFAQSADAYQSTCGNLFERMINTVPSQVTLTDVIRPIPVKPSVFLDIQQDGSLLFTGEVRFFDMPSNPKRVVKLLWRDRNGQCTQGTCSSIATHTEFQVSRVARNRQSMWYSFNATIDSNASISEFWFEVRENRCSPPREVFSETGTPFPFDDRLFIVPSMSCDQGNGDGVDVKTTFAIRMNSQPVDPRLLVTTLNLGTLPFEYTRSDSTVAATLSSNSTSPHYQLYTADFQENDFGLRKKRFFDIAAQIGGEDVRDAGWKFDDLSRSPFECPT